MSRESRGVASVAGLFVDISESNRPRVKHICGEVIISNCFLRSMRSVCSRVPAIHTRAHTLHVLYFTYAPILFLHYNIDSDDTIYLCLNIDACASLNARQSELIAFSTFLTLATMHFSKLFPCVLATCAAAAPAETIPVAPLVSSLLTAPLWP
jgi:hypothetical protein